MTRLFDAYFRVAGEKAEETLTGAILPLDLPQEGKPDSFAAPKIAVSPRPGAPPASAQTDKDRYHFYAKFTNKGGWVVQAALKLEHRVMSKGVESSGMRR